ncbi:MAG: acyltransferase [Leptolyngbyaceae cyanobacterium SM1_1_3]|nr:acyltransferase [Leptolyngbyaceae cyanobacterium SM1_1_3]NJN02530.1 acyltransferase [Leptolyngbyaceae cyanobacterium RM1_1_2]NJO08550.1 acyltransferase [Leptolyngbyaceae cyanobacterium SL_1_1]
MLHRTGLRLLRDRLPIFNSLSERAGSKNLLPSLDGLRAIAVILVFLEHITGNVFREDTVESGAFFGPFLNFGDVGMGRSGVYLFFVLSSFLLTSQLLKPHINFRDPVLWINYGFKRFIRIYPLYLCVLIVYYKFPSFKYDFGDVLSHLALQRAENHFWTLPVEIKYYFILPGIAWLMSRVLKRNLLLTILASVSLILLLSLMSATVSTPARLSILPHLPVFLVGSLAALVQVKLLGCTWLRQRHVSTVMEAIAILSLIGIVLSLPVGLSHGLWFWLSDKVPAVLAAHWVYQLQGCLWAVFLVSHLHGRGWTQRFLSWKPLRHIGVVSFGIYLWHIAVLGYLDAHLEVPSFVKMLAITVVTVSVATVTYITIEQPAMQLRLPLPQPVALAKK